MCMSLCALLFWCSCTYPWYVHPFYRSMVDHCKLFHSSWISVVFLQHRECLVYHLLSVYENIRFICRLARIQSLESFYVSQTWVSFEILEKIWTKNVAVIEFKSILRGNSTPSNCASELNQKYITNEKIFNLKKRTLKCGCKE